LICSAREGLQSPVIDQIPALPVPPLNAMEAEALLDSRFPGLDRTVRQRVLDQAAGNPLALTELPATLPSDLLSTGLLPSWLPISTHLEQTFAGRVSGLPPTTRSALLVAALSEGNGISDILRATAQLERGEVGVDVLEPAISARLIDVTETELRFRHPLMRSAVY